jgi:two-component system chemotaxis response regulator CheB
VLKLIIVDDCRTARAALRFALEKDHEILVLGEAENGAQALSLLERYEPDLLTMDVYLGSENGLDLSRQIMATHPLPIVVLTAAALEGTELAYQALQHGALEARPKLPAPHHPDYAKRCRELRRLLHNLSKVPVLHAASRRVRSAVASSRVSKQNYGEQASRPIDKNPASRELGSAELASQAAVARPFGPPSARSVHPFTPTMLLIGASTGGPQLLARLLSSLPASFAFPVLVVQHIAAGFGEGFASWLAEASGHPCDLLSHRCSLVGGRIYLAPDSRDLCLLAPCLVEVCDPQPGASIAPSIDVCFESAAAMGAMPALALLLTGMGRDGARGMARLHRAGAVSIAQSPSTCTVDSMPKAAIQEGVSAVMEPEQMMDYLQRCAALKR